MLSKDELPKKELSKEKKIQNRYKKDVEMYENEIKELTEKISKEEDEYLRRNYERMLLESKRVLESVLKNISSNDI